MTQTSFAPPLVVVGVKDGTGTLDRIKAKRKFAVSVLGTGQKDIAFAYFKHVEPEGGKLGGYAYEMHTTGAPVISDAPAWFECELGTIVAEGDHVIIVGKVVEAGVKAQVDSLTLKECGVNYGG